MTRRIYAILAYSEDAYLFASAYSYFTFKKVALQER